MTETATTVANDLLSLSLGKDFTLALTVNPRLVVIIILICIALFAIRWLLGFRSRSNFEIDTAEVGLGPGTISFKPNYQDEQIAYKIWVELSTRKIGLPIDLEHDVISEIYDSWHNFFSITRELIKDVPVNKVKNQSTRKIIQLSINVLNEGLRPHLTSWQARFRHWYERQLETANGDIDPQSLQKNYPRYTELKDDLVVVNNRLIKYRDKMHQLVLGLPGDKK